MDLAHAVLKRTVDAILVAVQAQDKASSQVIIHLNQIEAAIMARCDSHLATMLNRLQEVEKLAGGTCFHGRSS